MFIVELESGVWLAAWPGDPGRTLLKKMANQFKTIGRVKKALTDARKYRRFNDAKIEEVKQ